MRLPFATLDVFTTTRFGGNPLAVVLGADALTDQQMQVIAREFGYSETAFVCRPQNPDHTARVRIFTPGSEVPFAGHPNVGTAVLLAGLHGGEFMSFEEKAGLVAIRLNRRPDGLFAAELTAPEPFSRRREIPPEIAANFVGIAPADIVTSRHLPVIASVGLPFLLVEIASRAALSQARPVVSAFAQHMPKAESDAIFLYTRDLVPADGIADVTARMFAPWDGVPEDPATGSASGALGGLLATVAGTPGQHSLRIAQGIDMGRPSQITVTADIAPDGAPTVRIAGSAVPVTEGFITI